MPARRRRPGSESEQTQSLLTNESTHLWNQPEPVTNNRNFPYPNQVVTNQYDVESSNFHERNSSQNVDEMTTTSQDRTLEFTNTVRLLQSRNASRFTIPRDPHKAAFIRSHSEFMSIAKIIGKNIASTYTKLEKLTLLAKEKSLFNDRSSEIQELTYIIKGDLNSLNQQIARLQEISKLQQNSHTGKHLMSHTSSVVLALQSKLASMSTDFKQILESRTESLKQQKHRRDQFSQGPISSSLPPSVVQGHHQGSVLLADEHVSLNLEGAMVPASSSQLQQQKMLMYDETDTYLQSRAETMQNIESTIIELGGIFQQLAHMVKEQEEMVERIDINVQDAEMNIDAAHTQILKYFQSVTSNRWLMIKIFAVLIAFFLFFVVFVA